MINNPVPLMTSSAKIASTGAKFFVTRRPKLPADAKWYAKAAKPTEERELRAMFFGVATVALTDGDTTLMFDGFFSRPGAADVLFGKVAPNHPVIDAALNQAEIESLAAVLVAHSHYDHAMDAPAVAWRTGAALVGSESTLNIGRGFGLPSEKLVEVDLAEPMKFGRFSVTSILSEHSPKPKFTGLIEGPLHVPTRVRNYRVGECYSFVVTHTSESGHVKRLLMHASAGFAPDCLRGQQADVAFLGMAPIGKQPDAYRQEYWAQTVTMVGARRVYPTHWDDFTRPLSQPLVPLPYIGDDFGVTLDFLTHKHDADGTEILIPQPFLPLDPFEDLP